MALKSIIVIAYNTSPCIAFGVIQRIVYGLKLPRIPLFIAARGLEENKNNTVVIMQFIIYKNIDSVLVNEHGPR